MKYSLTNNTTDLYERSRYQRWSWRVDQIVVILAIREKFSNQGGWYLFICNSLYSLFVSRIHCQMINFNRSKVVLTLLAITAAFWTVFTLQNPSSFDGLSRDVIMKSTSEDSDPFRNARNSTLGFAKMLYINLPTRFDRDDAIFMQSTVTGLTPDRALAVDASTLEESGKGFPPSENNKLLSPPVRACTRSHANLWKQMIQENWETLLILEADAAWDVNIKDINYRVAKGLYELRNNLNESIPLPAEDDPFGVRDGDWDIISFGTCHDRHPYKDDFVLVDDPDMPEGFKYYGRPLDGQRAVRRAGCMVCTTGYAISQRGASKMLLRQALNSNKAIDLILCDVIGDGEVKAYATYPPTIAQWVYTEGIGAEGLGSNINNKAAKNSENAKEIWKKIKSEKNIWALRSDYYKGMIKNLALSAYNKLAIA